MDDFKNGNSGSTQKIREAEQEVSRMKSEYQQAENAYKRMLHDGDDTEALKKRNEMALLGDRIKFTEQKLEGLKTRQQAAVVEDIREIQEAAAEAVKENNGHLEKIQAEVMKKKQDYENAVQDMVEETNRICGIRRRADYLAKRYRARTDVNIPRVSCYAYPEYKVEAPPHTNDLPMD